MYTSQFSELAQQLLDGDNREAQAIDIMLQL